jgi:hypothetical protein
MVNALGVERAGAAFYTVDFKPLFEKEFGKIGAVLAGDASNQSNLFLLL